MQRQDGSMPAKHAGYALPSRVSGEKGGCGL
jgi:hypothetical protein